MQFDKIIKLIKHLDGRGEARFHMALSTFFGECLLSDFSPFEEHALDLMTVKEEVGEEVFQHLFMCAVEFFLSNEYPGDSESWNAIDFILKKRGPLLPSQDKMYLKGLRESYMSLYEVIDVKLNHSLTLRDLLEENQPPIIIKEKRGTHFLCQWDLLGARVVKTQAGHLLAGGTFLLSRDAAREAKEVIHKISKVMMSKENLRRFQEETKDPVLMVKKMWVKEFAQAWLVEQMQKEQEPTFFNYDGDKLQFYTIEFSLNRSLAEVVKAINKLPELKPHDIEDVTHAWIWPLQTRKDISHRRKQKVTQEKEREIFMDTQLAYEDGMSYRLFAELKIKGKKLLIDVNSEQRANIAEDFFQTHLTSLVGKPTRLQHDLKTSQDGTETSKELRSGLSVEAEEKLKEKFFDQHYREWLDSPLPALKGKTPRQAAKTKAGIQHVTDLLKDMVNAELRAVKQGRKTTPYDFDWLFSELCLERYSL